MHHRNKRARVVQLTAIGCLVFWLAACMDVQTPVVPTMAPDRSVTPTPIPVQPTPQSTPQLASSSLAVDDQGFADPAFRTLWERFDGDVARGTASRSWYWGQPVPFGAVDEPYAESPGGKRLVQYFEKGRMEINDPSADSSQDWYVTSGLLTVELVSGQVQIGEDSFEPRSPAPLPVAGDLDQPLTDTPQYADYTSKQLAPISSRVGQEVTTLFTHDSGESTIDAPATVTISSFDSALGHNIPDVFTSYFDHDLSAMGLDWLYVMGHPISEPYWVNASFGGKTHQVLVQLFERRALSFDPTSPVAEQVQFTNIGLHYYRWRYHEHTSAVPPNVPIATTSDLDLASIWRARS